MTKTDEAAERGVVVTVAAADDERSRARHDDVDLSAKSKSVTLVTLSTAGTVSSPLAATTKQLRTLNKQQIIDTLLQL